MVSMPVQVKRGELVEFVRWIPTPLGWTHELIVGTYLARDAGHWYTIVGRQPRCLDRSEWELCRR